MSRPKTKISASYCILAVFAILFVFFTLAGCSKSQQNPILMNSEDNITSDFENNSSAQNNYSGTGLLGEYELLFDRDFSSAELKPVRKGSLGESFIVSGIPFFTTQPCRDCLKISSLGFTSDGDIRVGFTISHPFEKGDIGKPPSGKNRLDLDIFDVALLVSSQNVTPVTFPRMNVDVAINAIMNADGYTSELGMILPYKICYSNSNNNRFEMGTKNHGFEVIFPKTGLTFHLYLTFGYGASSTLPTRLTPTYYIPEFNRKAAWRVEVDNAIWNGNNPTNVAIRVYDWNHGVIVASNFPDPNHTDYISEASDAKYVFVEVPGMTKYLAGGVLTDSVTNGWDDPLTFTATFKNDNRLGVGEYPGLVCVIDSRSRIDGGPGGTLVQTRDGVTLEMSDLSMFASYQTFIATVESVTTGCGPITGEIINPDCPAEVNDGETLDFVVSASSANGGNPITLYEVDNDYDGITFNADATSNDGNFQDVGPFHCLNYGGDKEEQQYTVAFRATDSCVPANKIIFESCIVNAVVPFNPVDVTPPLLRSFIPQDVFIDSHYAYITSNDYGLFIFDISDPVNPVCVKWVETPTPVDLGVYVSGGYAYVANSYYGLQIIDIEPPESAYIVKSVDTLGSAYGVYVSGGYAYVAAGDFGLQIIDIEPPDSAYIVKTVDTPNNARGVCVSGGYAYVADLESGLQIIDIEPPESAYIVKSVDTPSYAWDVYVSNGYAYVADYDAGLQIIDIEPLESAYIVKTVVTPVYVNDVYVSGGYAYVADDDSGLQIIDIEPPESAYIVKTIDMSRRALGVYISSGYAYVADYESGLKIIDIEPPESAYIVKTVATLSGAMGVCVSGNYTYVADGNGLQIIDIEPPESAYIVKTVYTPRGASGVYVSGGYAYIADNESGLQMIDIEPPESAYIVKSVDTPGYAKGVYVSGGYAYVADGDSGLQIIDIEPPGLAYIVKTVDTPGYAEGVYVSGGYAYVADGDSGLQIIDIEPPGLAYIIKTVDTLEYPRGVYVSDGYAYVADSYSGLQIIDIEPPGSAYFVREIETPGKAGGVYISSDYAFVADDDGGLCIIKLW